jgi:hypothetical protein
MCIPSDKHERIQGIIAQCRGYTGRPTSEDRIRLWSLLSVLLLACAYLVFPGLAYSAGSDPDGQPAYSAISDSTGYDSAAIAPVDEPYEQTMRKSSLTPVENPTLQQPEYVYPEAGDAEVHLEPELRSSAFRNPNGESEHARTQWRIEATTGEGLIMDMTCSTPHLTELRLPGFVLDPSSGYRLWVRHFDGSDQSSPWSAPIECSTAADPHDLNGDRIPDSQEIERFIDLNGDGVDDRKQSRQIRSIKTIDGTNTLGVSVDTSTDGAEVAAAANINPSTLPEPFFTPDEMTSGLLRYKIRLRQPGQTIRVTLYWSDPVDPGTTWLRYDSISGWEDISNLIDIHPDGTRITRTVVDGGNGDSDGVANGIIIDQCGPLTVNQAAVSDAEGNASAGVDATTCFIHTIGQLIQ